MKDHFAMFQHCLNMFQIEKCEKLFKMSRNIKKNNRSYKTCQKEVLLNFI